MAKQSRAQKKTVERVMHEFKHGELKTARGQRKVKSRRQAIAIGLREAGASKYDSPKKRSKNLARTKRKESRGQTSMQEREGKRSIGKLARRSSGRSASSRTRRSTAAKRRRTAASSTARRTRRPAS
jgi:Family of unknown function (DUF6496)